ncbi:DUF2184 domain-containing protein [Pasteurella caecimuris]|uniref:DUF2184 domain-containing protein n=1 Tax=Rodentibacter caecimuris TaxID=1796644 RepID=UPI00214FA17E|nr:DUF2184 domain-containing protein [Pasteurella caecimuris]MCR1838600.1 DUF2184 domain-containing protein [Pasteurella caecimuris]MCU0107897.1 DUF2184 domain-containing protein [Pasteurella caecimuris]
MEKNQIELSEINKCLNAAGIFNQDAGLFTARQLEVVRNKIYEEKLPAMNGLALVPISHEAPEWAETLTEKTFDMVGMAKIIANYADDLPRADVAMSERAIKVKGLGAAYGYNLQELKAAAANQTDLPSAKARAARRAVEVKMNTIALLGDKEYGLNGFIHHPNLGETTLTGGWKTATAESVLADLDNLHDTVILQSKGVHKPTHLLLSLTDYQTLSSKYMDTADKLDVLSFFKKKHPNLTIEGIWELEKAGTDGKNIAICYEKNLDNLSLEVPQDFTQLPAQERNLELVVNCIARVGGVFLRYPLSATKAEIA